MPDASERIDALVAGLPDGRGETLAALRRTLLAADPALVEEWKWRGAPVWSRGGIVCVAAVLEDRVKVTFPRGAGLPDPDRLFNNGLGGGRWRAVDLRPGDRIPKRAWTRLVRAAVALNLSKAAPSGRGGRSRATGGKAPGPAAKPVLLSGGNPQIPKGDGDGPVQAYLAALPAWKRAVGRRLDALVVRTVPGVRKAVRWNSPFYGVEGRGWFLSFHAIARYVKVAFFKGASLRPLPPVASKVPGVRYLHVHEGEWPDDDLLADWIRQAAALPGEDLF
ncbi:MAG: DUF1801 domain-containing protein [Planctomycetes bacterium]|nr:DUF1801 domain-containing protein [Planctomycetota bacterium]